MRKRGVAVGTCDEVKERNREERVKSDTTKKGSERG